MRKRKFISPFEVGIPSKEDGLQALIELAIEYDLLSKHGVRGNKKFYAVFAKRYAYWHTLKEYDLLLAGFRYHPDYSHRLEFLGLLAYNLDNKNLLNYLDLDENTKTIHAKDKKLIEMDVFKHLFFQRFEVDRIRKYLKMHIDDMVRAFKTKSFLVDYKTYSKNYTPNLTVRTGLGPNDVMELTPIYCPPGPWADERESELLVMRLYPNTDDYKKMVEHYYFVISDIIHDRFLAYNFANLMYNGNPYVLIDLEAALKKPELREKYMYHIGLALLYHIVADIHNWSKRANTTYKEIYPFYTFMKFGKYSNKLTKLVRQIMGYFKFYYNDLPESHVDLFENEIIDTLEEYYEKSKNIMALTNIEPFVVLPGPIEFEIIS